MGRGPGHGTVRAEWLWGCSRSPRVVAGVVTSIVAVGAQSAMAAGAAASWRPVSPSTTPPALQVPSMAYDGATHQLILTGAKPGDTTNETWVWNGTTWNQLSPASNPPARFGGSMAYDAATQQLVLFGGCTESAGTTQSPTSGCLLPYVNDTWAWNGSTWNQQFPATSPTPRDGASMAYDSQTSQLVLVGGYNGSYLSDTWIWDGSRWNLLNLGAGSAPAASYAALGYDPAAGVTGLILHSGFGAADASSLWTGTTWEPAIDDATSICVGCGGSFSDEGAIGGASMAYDAATNQLVEFGGQQGSYVARMFDWVADTAVSPTQSPSARDVAAMAYDPDTSQMVLFGGYNGGYLGDTWVYAPPPPASTCAPFTDSFASDSSLSSAWQANTPLVSSVASDLGATVETPQLTFGPTGMDMYGAAGQPQFTGIQSVASCSGPFTFETKVDAVMTHGDTFVVDLVSADQSQALSVEANLDPINAPDYGIFASNTLSASSANVTVSTDPSLAGGKTYELKLSVDSSGNGTVTLSGGGLTSVTVSVGHVGTGPFSVVLGQHEPNSENPTVIGGNFGVSTWAGRDDTWVQRRLVGERHPDLVGGPGCVAVDGLTDRGRGGDRARLGPTGLEHRGHRGSGGERPGVAAVEVHPADLDGSGLIATEIHPTQVDPPPGGRGRGHRKRTGRGPTGARANPAFGSVDHLHEPKLSGGATASSCQGWPGILQGSAYANDPLESVTLAEVLTDPVSGGQLRDGRSRVSRRVVELTQLPPAQCGQLGPSPLSAIGLDSTAADSSNALTSWCNQLATLQSSGADNYTCNDFGIQNGATSTNVTLLTLALAGVPLKSIPLKSIPLKSIDLTVSPLKSIPLKSIDLTVSPLKSIPLKSIDLTVSPLKSIPLKSIDLTVSPLKSIPLKSIDLTVSPLKSIPLKSIDLTVSPLKSIPLKSIAVLSTVVDCSAPSLCAAGSAATLGDAAAAGAIITGATLGNLSRVWIPPRASFRR